VAALAYVSVFARDIEVLAAFYRDVFGFAEVAAYRTPIFRALAAGPVLLGFSSREAHTLLGLDAPPAPGSGSILLTFEVGSTAEVGSLTDRAAACGARIIKPAFDTYYGAVQSLLADPDGNLFRINYMLGS
jgi:catechol 2,3-dioxygenase-like lactoylglutathione lyase family enzyme